MKTSETIETRNPAKPEEIVSRAAWLDDREVERVLVGSSRAWPEWARSAALRATALNRWAQAIEDAGIEVAELMAREVGKPIMEAKAEVARSAAILRFYAQAAYEPVGEILPSADGKATLTSERHPLGVVLAITPWNFPAAIPIWKIAPALAYGNVVVLKPASAAVGTARRIVELSRPHVPADILEIAIISASQAERLLADARVAGVSFTGSAPVGRQVVRRVAARGGAVQAEMGGQNPSIVLDDANVAAAAATIAGAAMAYAGQKCTATSRVIVSRGLAPTFRAALSEAVTALAVGDPMDESTTVGPLISRDARETVSEAVRATLARGASRVVGGETPDRDGWFYTPALIEVSDPLDPFVQEETFGPAAAILVVDDDAQAVHVANSTRYGLSAAVFGRDLERAARVARQLRAGLVRVNGSTTGVDFHAPFGGERESSYGPKEQGRAAREFYTTTRTILGAGA